MRLNQEKKLKRRRQSKNLWEWTEIFRNWRRVVFTYVKLSIKFVYTFFTRRAVFSHFLVFILIISWLFSGWPQIYNFPPKIQKAQADTTTVYASSYSVDGTLGEWTNQTYVYSDDGTNFATRTGSVKNTWYGNLFGFDLSGIPDGATINSVTITAEWKNSANDTAGPVLYLGAKSGGVEVGTATSDTSGQTTFELVTNSPTGLTAANLKATGASGFWAILRFRRTDNTAHIASVDYVKVYVDYTPIVAPTVSTQAASSVEATTATGNGNITATGGQNATAWGVCYKTSTGCTTADSVAAGSGTGGTGAFTASMTSLSSGTTYYIKAYATNSAGTSYGSEVTILTKPAAPTGVSATDGTYTDKVTITWTKSTGATDYHVWRDSTDLGAAGDVATFDDTGADAPTITAGSAVASDGTNASYVELSVSGASANNGTSHTYKVVASNATGNSADSSTDAGYRGVGTLTYQWQRSAADSDASYSDISGATTASYNDTGAPADGSGRYYKVVENATGATQQISTADRGYRMTGPSSAIEIVAKAADTAITTITFPEGAPGATVSAPYNNVDGSGDPQILSGTISEPVVRLKNTSGGTLNVTLEITTWTNGIAASEDYELVVTTDTTIASVASVLSADGNAASVPTGIGITAGAYKALYLELVLSSVAKKSGASTLTILGETP